MKFHKWNTAESAVGVGTAAAWKTKIKSERKNKTSSQKKKISEVKFE